MADLKSYDSIIIGAGISGLSCAYYRGKIDSSILVLDPAEIGGVMQTVSKDGFKLETGPNVIIEKPAMAKLIDDLGLREYVVYPKIEDYKQEVFFNKTSLPAPRSLKGILKTPLIDLLDKARMFAAVFKGNLLPVQEDISVKDLFLKIIGRSGVSNILDPVMQGIYGGDVSRLSVRSLFPGIWQSMKSGKSFFAFIRSKTSGQRKSKIFIFRGGNNFLAQSLLKEIADRVVTVKKAAERIQYDQNSKLFTVTDVTNEQYHAKKVFIATSGSRSAGIIRELSETLSDRLRKINYAGLAVVHFSLPLDAAIPADSFGVLVPSHQQENIMGIMYNSVLFPEMAPKGRHLITVCLGGIKNPQILLKSDKELREIVSLELENRFHITDTTLLNVQRWENAIPQYEVGYYQVVEAMRALELQFPGLEFIGVDNGGVGVPDRIYKDKSVP